MSRPLRKTTEATIEPPRPEEPVTEGIETDINQIMRAIVLTDEDAARFEHRLANPKEPTQALRDLMRMKV